MKKLNEFFMTNMFSSVLFLMLGIILVINPGIVISIICYGLAIILLAIGINAMIKYIQDQSMRFNLLGSVFCFIASLFLFFRYEMIVSFIPFILGLYIIISSALKIEYIFHLKNNNNPKYLHILITVIISFICGLLLVFNPFSSTLTITRIIGIFITIYSVLDIYQNYILKKEINNFIKKR